MSKNRRNLRKTSLVSAHMKNKKFITRRKKEERKIVYFLKTAYTRYIASEIIGLTILLITAE